MALRLSVRDNSEVRDLIIALKSARAEVQRDTNARTRKVIAPEWTKAATENATTHYEASLAGTTRVAATAQNITLKGASVRGHRYSGGLDMRKSWASIEHGGSATKVKTYKRKNRKNPGTHDVTRHTMRHLKARNKKGYVLNPAQEEIFGRAIRLWVQTAMRTIYDHLDKKG